MRFYLIDQLVSIFLLSVIIIIQQLLLAYFINMPLIVSRINSNINFGNEVLRLITNGEIDRLVDDKVMNYTFSSNFSYVVIVLLKNESYFILYLKRK